MCSLLQVAQAPTQDISGIAIMEALQSIRQQARQHIFMLLLLARAAQVRPAMYGV